MHLKDRVILFIASGGHIGKVPIAPGTFGSLVGLPICYFFPFVKLKIVILFTILFIVFSIWIAQRAERLLDAKDPGIIVIDEIAGLFVTFIGISFIKLSVHNQRVISFRIWPFFLLVLFVVFRVYTSRIFL